MRGRVPLPQDGVALAGDEKLQAPDRTPGIRNRSLQQPDKTRRNRLHARRARTGRWHIPALPRSQPDCRPPRAAPQGSATGRTSRSRPQPAQSRTEPRQLEPSRGIVLQHQHHLEQRMPRQRARRVEHLHQPLERKLLVPVGRQVARTHPTNKLAEARIARRVRAQNQRVDEEPHKFVERAVRATRNRAPDRNVLPAPQPREQRRKPGLQHHEQARPARTRQIHKPTMQGSRQRQRNAPPAMARHRRPHMVARQIDLVR